MSHVSTIEVEIKSLKSLKAACKRLGLQFIEDKKTYKWFERHVGDYPLPEGFKVEDLGKCEHAIKVPGAKYEVGVVRDPFNKKNYKLQWDFWDKGLPAVLGNNAWKLTQAYTVEHTKYVAKLQGKRVIEKKMDDRIRLVVQM